MKAAVESTDQITPDDCRGAGVQLHLLYTAVDNVLCMGPALLASGFRNLG